MSRPRPFPLRTPHTHLEVFDLGAAVPYAVGMERMRSEIDALRAEEDAKAGRLLLLEHADVVTVTRSGGTEHLFVTPEQMRADGIDVIETDRGGDVTFHGAGQLVGYPVLRLGPGQGLRVDLLGYLRALEDSLCRVAQHFGVGGVHRKEGMTGVWVASDSSTPEASWAADESARKLVAIGVGVGRGVTRHGFALNVTTDLERFTSRITPCGLVGRPVTSLERELGNAPSIQEVKRIAAIEVARGLSLTLTDGADPDQKSSPLAATNSTRAASGANRRP